MTHRFSPDVVGNSPNEGPAFLKHRGGTPEDNHRKYKMQQHESVSSTDIDMVR
jgi:hypothetical protein